jgi:biotin synthase-like enzyme
MEQYVGYEQGPIRPPSEAKSLLLRVTRNCPWNRCAFCPVYKGAKFSRRPVEHVLRDIDVLSACAKELLELKARTGRILHSDFNRLAYAVGADRRAFHAAYHFINNGMASVFLQDANTLMSKPDGLAAILERLREAFPAVRRVTSYARSRTVARMADQDLARLSQAGLGRVHIGMESGSDEVLSLMSKGVDKEAHIQGGQKVKAAGLELSEYYIPGLGGRELSREHVRESADALNRINPDFIRLRTLCIPADAPLASAVQAGRFDKMGDVETSRELLDFLEALDGVSSMVTSDHVLNLLPEVQGRLPQDKERLTAPLRHFLEMDREDQAFFQLGRRLMLLERLSDLDSPVVRRRVLQAWENLGASPENVDHLVDELMSRFV